MKEVFKKNGLWFLSLFVAFLDLTGCKERMNEVVSSSPTDDLARVPHFGFAGNNVDGQTTKGIHARKAKRFVRERFLAP